MTDAEKRFNDLIKRKIKQWRDKAKKMTEEAAKNRIAKWLEERYRIANARKNWIDLSTKYDLFMNNRLLYEIRKRLTQFAKARDMVDKLRFRFLKTGKDQFCDGVKFMNFLNFLKQLVENWNDRNKLLALRHYFNKWADKARKLKEREDALNKAMDEINKRILTGTVDILTNAMISSKPLKAIPVARAYDVFDRLRTQYRDWYKLRGGWMELMEKYMTDAEKRFNDLIKRKILSR